MNFKTTVALLVTLAIVGGILFFTSDKGEKSSTDVVATDQKKLFDLSIADINKITISPADGKKIVLEKNGVNWQLIEPVKASADVAEVSTLVNSLGELQSRGKLDLSGDKMKATGLDNPRIKVEIATNKGTKNLNVGEKSTVGDSLYVSVGDSKEANVVDGKVSDTLEKPADNYRNKRLTDINVTDVQQITITGDKPESKISLLRSGQDWQIVAPTKMPAEKSIVEDLLFAIAGLKAEEFVSEGGDVKPYQLDAPRLTVFMSKETPSTQPATQATSAPATQPSGITLKFGRFDSVLQKSVMAISSLSPAVAKVPATILPQLTKTPLDLRDRRAATIDPTQVSKITITSDLKATTQPTSRPASKTEIALIRRKENVVLGPATPTTKPATTQSTTGPATIQATTQAATQPTEPPSKWQFASDEKTNVDDPKVEALLTAVNPLRAEKYLEARPTTQPSESFTISITTEGPGGTPVNQHEIHLTQISADQPVIGDYNGLAFEIAPSLLQKLSGDFKKSSAAPAMPMRQPNEAFPESP